MEKGSRQIWENWREKLWSNFVRLESSSSDDHFFGDVERAADDSNRLCRVRSTLQLTERTYGHIRSDQRELVLVALQRTGHGYVEQDDRQARLEPGDFAFYDTTRPYRLYFERPFEQTILRLPRKHFTDRLPAFNRLTARRFSGSSGAGRVATSFIEELGFNAPALRDHGLASFDVAAADLLCTAIQMAEDGRSASSETTLERIQRKLLAHIRDPHLDLAHIAGSEDMSLRSLQRLFHAFGTTATQWISERRLNGIAAELRSPANASRSATDIALSWGFNDVSHFSRAFKRQFGMAPSEWRRGSLPF